MFNVKTLQGKIVQFQTGSRHFSILRQFTQHLQKWLQSLVQSVANQSSVALTLKKVSFSTFFPKIIVHRKSHFFVYISRRWKHVGWIHLQVFDGWRKNFAWRWLRWCHCWWPWQRRHSTRGKLTPQSLFTFLKVITTDNNLSKICLQRGLSSAGPTAAAVGTLEEKLAALEKSRDYNTGLNNLQTDNVAIPPRAIGYVNHINFARFKAHFLMKKYLNVS